MVVRRIYGLVRRNRDFFTQVVCSSRNWIGNRDSAVSLFGSSTRQANKPVAGLSPGAAEFRVCVRVCSGVIQLRVGPRQ